MLPTPLDPTADFGLPKDNYRFVVNPRTEVDFAEYERLCTTVAQLSHTVPKALLRCDDTAGVQDYASVWGDTVSVRPTVVRTGTGIYTITWAASYADLNPTVARQVSTPVAIRFAVAAYDVFSGYPVNTLYPSPQAALTSANVVTVYTFDSGGASDAAFTLVVY